MTRKYKDGNTRKKFFCAKCNQVLDKKYVGNHDPEDITWLSATEHEEKEKKVDELQNETDEDKEKAKAKRFAADKDELRKLDDDELDKIKESLLAELDELKKDKKKDSKNASKRYSVLAIDSYNFDSMAGDCILKEMGSSD